MQELKGVLLGALVILLCSEQVISREVVKSHKITKLGENSDVLKDMGSRSRSRRSLPSEQQKAYALDTHNLFRRMEGASNMKLMVTSALG